MWRGWWLAYGEPLVAKSSELGFIPAQPPSKGGVLALLIVSNQLCASACLEDGPGQRSSGSLRCSGAAVPSCLAGRGSLGAFPWFVPLTLWWVHCNTHSFKNRQASVIMPLFPALLLRRCD